MWLQKKMAYKKNVVQTCRWPRDLLLICNKLKPNQQIGNEPSKIMYYIFTKFGKVVKDKNVGDCYLPIYISI